MTSCMRRSCPSDTWREARSALTSSVLAITRSTLDDDRRWPGTCNCAGASPVNAHGCRLCCRQSTTPCCRDVQGGRWRAHLVAHPRGVDLQRRLQRLQPLRHLSLRGFVLNVCKHLLRCHCRVCARVSIVPRLRLSSPRAFHSHIVQHGGLRTQRVDRVSCYQVTKRAAPNIHSRTILPLQIRTPWPRARSARWW